MMFCSVVLRVGDIDRSQNLSHMENGNKIMCLYFGEILNLL